MKLFLLVGDEKHVHAKKREAFLYKTQSIKSNLLAMISWITAKYGLRIEPSPKLNLDVTSPNVILSTKTKQQIPAITDKMYINPFISAT